MFVVFVLFKNTDLPLNDKIEFVPKIALLENKCALGMIFISKFAAYLGKMFELDLILIFEERVLL
jgi:two-component SAPR family response regulator